MAKAKSNMVLIVIEAKVQMGSKTINTMLDFTLVVVCYSTMTSVKSNMVLIVIEGKVQMSSITINTMLDFVLVIVL